MKLFRFMSEEEFIKYNNGEILVNNTNHNKDNNRKTDSVGFCFLNYAHFKPEEAYHFIIGCSGVFFDYDICAIFETDRNNVINSRGRYAEPINPIEYNCIPPVERKKFIAKEYCTTKYSKETFKLLQWAKPEWINWDNWEWQSHVID